MMLSAALLLVACGPGPSVVEREGEPVVLVYPPGDDAMHQATRDIFVARDELSADQRAAFEQSLGFRMPPTPKRF